MYFENEPHVCEHNILYYYRVLNLIANRSKTRNVWYYFLNFNRFVLIFLLSIYINTLYNASC